MYRTASWDSLLAGSLTRRTYWAGAAALTKLAYGSIGPVRRIATIGVYEFDAPGFIQRLDEAGVTQLVDIRQRRGVRGAQYAWANARRLQALLSDARIGYEYHPELAPNTELRQLQYRDDDRQGVGKRSRIRLAPEYIRQYTEQMDAALPYHGGLTPGQAVRLVEASPWGQARIERLRDIEWATTESLGPLDSLLGTHPRWAVKEEYPGAVLFVAAQ